MDHAEALQALESDVIEIRLRGARYMSLNARTEDLPRLNELIQVENVRWIKTALARAIERAGLGGDPDLFTPAAAAAAEPPPDMLRDLKSEAVEEVAGTIIHEFAAVVGPLRIQAKREVTNYEQSQTKRMLDMLNELMRGVRNLKSAAAVPSYTEIDLPTLVQEAVTTIADEHQHLVSIAGASPFLVMVDRNHLFLAICNGLRNAVDAVVDSTGSQRPEVVVNWGRAGAEDWLAIIDTGPGFRGNPSAAITMGSTTKTDHIGFGLATAQQAMRVMEGDVWLSNGPEGGARFELRWFRANANSVR